jgi:hypothetical protein
MPNWCNNQLDIRGDKTQIADLISRVTKTDDNGNTYYDILGSLLTTPQGLLDTMAGGYGRNEDGTKKPEQIELEAKEQSNIAEYGHKNWYDWNLANWGTKWGDSDTHIVAQYDDMVSFVFESPWSPPETGIENISKLFPELSFVIAYSEEGMDFYGATAFRNGERAEDGGEIMNIEGIKQIDYDDDGWEDLMEHNQDLLDDALEKAKANAEQLLEVGQ